MQFPEMGAFNQILRSQSSLLLNPSKFNILHPSINSIIHLNQNPNFSRRFRLIHSNTGKLSPELPRGTYPRNDKSRPWNTRNNKSHSGKWQHRGSYPRNENKHENSGRKVEYTGNRVDVTPREPRYYRNSCRRNEIESENREREVESTANRVKVTPREAVIEARPRVCSVPTESNPRSVIKHENSENEIEGNRVDVSEANSVKVTPQEAVIEAKPRVLSVSGSTESYPRNVIKHENSEREVEGNRVDVSDANAVKVTPHEPDIEAKPRVWSVFGSTESNPRSVIKHENSEREVVGNRVDVSEANAVKVTPQEAVIEAKPRVWSVFGSEESNPRSVIKHENSEREVEGNWVDVSDANAVKVTPHELDIEAKPRVWSVFGSVFRSKESNPTNVIKPENSEREVEGNRVDESEANSLKVTSQEAVIEAKTSVGSVFSLTDPRNVTKSESSEREVEIMGNRVDVLETNSLKVTPQEPDVEANPRVWSVYGSTESYPKNVMKSENSERKVESTGAPESLSSSVVESVVSPEEPNSEAKPRGCSVVGGLTESYPRNVTKSENSVRKVENTESRVYVSEEQEISYVSSYAGKGKTGKSKVWVCNNCGHSPGQWWGQCPSCKETGTVKQFSMENERSGGRGYGHKISENVTKKSWLPEKMVEEHPPVRLTEVNRGMNHLEWRIRLSGLFGYEVNRVLGSGVVPGSVILIGGDPGVGKSTLALQMAALISGSCDVGGSAPVVYVSGEESVEQVGNRADRLNINSKDLFLYSGTDVDDILERVQVLSPRALIIDSIQTVYVKAVSGGPGSTSQVKECTSTLVRYAKRTKVPVVLIGHVTKTGDLAGPHVLEHLVDVVLYMEGEKHSTNRVLRSIKNRFGSTDELGIFRMLESGLEAVSNPSEMFLREEYLESDHLVGLAVAVVLDGSRTFLIEVQALCVSGSGLYATGIPQSRAEMIISVLRKQAGLKLRDNSIFLNAVSGVFLKETSGDLALAAAICSSFLEFPLPNNVAFIGEIGLGGELRMVSRIEKRVHTLAKLGYKKCIVPFSAEKALSAISSEIEIVGCKNLKEVIDNVFRKED